MKKTFAVLLAGVAALSAVIYVSNKVQAEPAAPAGIAAPRTRIALLNLNYVIKNYSKYKSFQKDVADQAKKYQDEIETKRTLIEKLKAELPKPELTAAQREEKAQQIRTLTREVEDITAKARSEVSKQGTDAMVMIYKEVRDAAHRHAVASGFDVVLHFEEATTEAELDTPKNIMRKMNAGGCVPMYWKNGMDISWHVLNALNTKHAGTAPKTGK